MIQKIPNHYRLVFKKYVFDFYSIFYHFSSKCIYGRPGQELLITQISCPVLHHNTTPTFYEEIKLRLPLNITAQHHILFTFYHISCNITKKKDYSIAPETSVGYAWLPLLNKGKLNIEEHCLPVAATLPAGYLSIQPLGLGKGVRFILFPSMLLFPLSRHLGKRFFSILYSSRGLEVNISMRYVVDYALG